MLNETLYSGSTRVQDTIHCIHKFYMAILYFLSKIVFKAFFNKQELTLYVFGIKYRKINLHLKNNILYVFSIYIKAYSTLLKK